MSPDHYPPACCKKRPLDTRLLFSEILSQSEITAALSMIWKFRDQTWKCPKRHPPVYISNESVETYEGVRFWKVFDWCPVCVGQPEAFLLCCERLRRRGCSCLFGEIMRKLNDGANEGQPNDLTNLLQKTQRQREELWAYKMRQRATAMTAAAVALGKMTGDRRP